MSEQSTSKALAWKLLERFGVQGVQFILQIILARLLDPEHYGALSIMIIFTNLATVFIQSGFNTALIQKKDADERDFSSVLWISLGVAGVLYAVIFFTAPTIANFYEIPEIIGPFRVLGLMLIPGAFNSIQLAVVSREMNFKKVFTSNVAGIIISGVVGVGIAYLGGGLWSLVAQHTINTVVTCIVMLFTVKWYPKLILDFKRIGSLFSFGWKLLASGLLSTLYEDLRSLVIGKKYDSGTLGFYNRGKQFPQFFIGAINGAVQTVLLPAMSKKQDDSAQVKEFTRTSIVVSSYILFPMMAGLAVVATPMVSLLLTDKWLPCVPYLQVYCFILAFYPIHSCNLQAINAMGRSDIFLKLEIIKKSIGIISLVIAVFCFETPLAIALTGAFTTIISSFINAFPNKKLINYSYLEQIKDLIPSFAVAGLMGVGVYLINYLDLSDVVKLIIQIPTGIVLYFGLSALLRVKGFVYLKTVIKMALNKKKQEIQIIEGADND